MVTITRCKIWIKMLFGRSDLHVNQPTGSFISRNKINGYYNDLSEKVTFNKKTSEIIDYIPIFKNDYGKKVVFPIQIIQYALGCYELYLKYNKQIYLKKMIHCSKFVVSLINDDGSIPCMYFVKGLTNPYSSMCQGECVSLLARAYKETGVEEFYTAACRAYNFLVNKNHPMAVIKEYNGQDCCFYEYPEKGIVLNGYIFSLFGVYDYYLLTKDERAKEVFDKSLSSLLKIVDDFDFQDWSYYDTDKHFASKFYHKLHIDLLNALDIICDNVFCEIKTKWEKGLRNKKLSRKMFWRKAKQKIINK